MNKKNSKAFVVKKIGKSLGVKVIDVRLHKVKPKDLKGLPSLESFKE